MDKNNLTLNHCYRITFPDGQPIDFKFKGNNNGSLLCEKKGGETFFLDTVEPYAELSEIDPW